jgi:hypothetical protein
VFSIVSVEAFKTRIKICNIGSRERAKEFCGVFFVARLGEILFTLGDGKIPISNMVLQISLYLLDTKKDVSHSEPEKD